MLAQDAAREMGDELGVGCILVVQVAAHLDHLAALHLPDGQELLRPAKSRFPRVLDKYVRCVWQVAWLCTLMMV